MIYLYTSFYNEQNAVRNHELLTCITRNMECKAFHRIFVLNEGGDLSKFSKENKLIVVNLAQRPTYQKFFDLINQNTTDEDINIIANTDIYFDEAIHKLVYLNLKRRCLALTRWDLLLNGQVRLFIDAVSQDSLIFKGKIENVYGDFFNGIYYCDARIAYEIHRGGYRISNPSFSIKTYHLHLSQYRTYKQISERIVIDPPYKELPPENLYNLFITLFNRFFRPERYYPYQLKTYKLKYQIKCLFNGIWQISNFIRNWGRQISVSKQSVFVGWVIALYYRIFRWWLPQQVEDVKPIIEKLAMQQKDICFVQAGAHDGVTDDPLHEFIVSNRWKGVVIEPVKSIFSALESNYLLQTNVTCLNIALAPQNGTYNLYYYNYGEKYDRLSSLKLDILRRYSWEKYPDIERDMKTTQTEGISFNSLMEKLNLNRCHLLRIDAVGLEYEIIKSVDYKKYRPSVLHFANSNLYENYRKCYKFLRRLGYKTYRSPGHSVAIDLKISGWL